MIAREDFSATFSEQLDVDAAASFCQTFQKHGMAYHSFMSEGPFVCIGPAFPVNAWVPPHRWTISTLVLCNIQKQDGHAQGRL